MDVPIQKIESHKGKPVIVVDGHTFRQAFLKKSGENKLALYSKRMCSKSNHICKQSDSA
jgi:hypothetical protein